MATGFELQTCTGMPLHQEGGDFWSEFVSDHINGSSDSVQFPSVEFDCICGQKQVFSICVKQLNVLVEVRKTEQD